MIGDAAEIGPADFQPPAIAKHDGEGSLIVVGRAGRSKINLYECGLGAPEAPSIIVQCCERQPMCGAIGCPRLVSLLISGYQLANLRLASVAPSFGSLHSYSETDSSLLWNQGDRRTLTIKQHLRIKAFFGTSENAVKTQIWIAVSVYVLVAIIRKRLGLDASLYQILQVLSVTPFDKMPILQALQEANSQNGLHHPAKQLNLWDF